MSTGRLIRSKPRTVIYHLMISEFTMYIGLQICSIKYSAVLVCTLEPLTYLETWRSIYIHIYAHTQLNRFAVHLKLIQNYQSTTLQHKIKTKLKEMALKHIYNMSSHSRSVRIFQYFTLWLQRPSTRDEEIKLCLSKDINQTCALWD